MGFKSCTSSPDMFSSFLAAPPKNEVLQKIATLVKWDKLRPLMARAYKPGVGCEGYDPVLLFKLLLLEQYYQLSDGDAVWMAKDSLSFRQFLGLEASDRVPDDTTLVVFRRRLREAGLLDELFVEVTVQLEKQGIGVREGSIKVVDATIIQAAVRPPSKPKDGQEAPKALDPDAEFTVKNGKVSYGYKLHLAQDRETGLLTSHVVTSANVHDTSVFADLVDGTESEVLADKAYDSKDNRDLLGRNATRASLMRRAKRNKPLTRWQRGRNRSIGRVRSFIEGANACLKRWLRCGRAVYIGIERTMLQMTFGVLAYNLARASALQRDKCK